jgi:serine/threonine protein kinase
VRRDGPSAPSALHREGIVHGNVKPSNIMLTRTGNAKLIDIGAAFAREDAPLHAGLRRAQRPEGSVGPERSSGRWEGVLRCIPCGDSPRTSTHRSCSRPWPQWER